MGRSDGMQWTVRDTLIVVAMTLTALALGLAARLEFQASGGVSIALMLGATAVLLGLHFLVRMVANMQAQLAQYEARFAQFSQAAAPVYAAPANEQAASSETVADRHIPGTNAETRDLPLAQAAVLAGAQAVDGGVTAAPGEAACASAGAALTAEPSSDALYEPVARDSAPAIGNEHIDGNAAGVSLRGSLTATLNWRLPPTA